MVLEYNPFLKLNMLTPGQQCCSENGLKKIIWDIGYVSDEKEVTESCGHVSPPQAGADSRHIKWCYHRYGHIFISQVNFCLKPS
jgi:hypothetical protein